MKDLLMPIEVHHIPPTPRVYVDSKKRYFSAKRIFDVCASVLIMTLVLSWLIPIIAVLIKLESRGPVFFIQRRVGKAGKAFSCLKFRTMVVNNRANCTQAEIDDKRITRLGQFLRISNLDEFPQFLNVLAGHMSIVGPRPHMHADCARFSAVVGGYKFRNMVKPGITGLAQIKGYRGPTLDFASIFHRYQFDAFYVRNASLALDMRIIRITAMQTASAILSRLKPTPEAVEERESERPFARRRWVHAIRSFLS